MAVIGLSNGLASVRYQAITCNDVDPIVKGTLVNKP